MLLLVFLPPGWAPRSSRNPCQHELIFSVCCQALRQETGPHSLLGLLSQHPRLQVPPSTKGCSGKAGHTEGVAGMGFPQLSIYMGMWVSLAMCAAALARREQPSTHTRHMPVTSPRLVLPGPISSNTHASTCPVFPNTLPGVWGEIPAQLPLWSCGPDPTGVTYQALRTALSIQ